MSVIQLLAEGNTFTLNEYTFGDFAEGDFIELSFPNAKTSRTNAPNGVTVSPNSISGVCIVKARVQKYGADHRFLNNALNQASPVIFNGSSKESFIRDGAEAMGDYTLENGSITDQPTDAKNNTEGNAMVEFTIEFRNGKQDI